MDRTQKRIFAAVLALLLLAVVAVYVFTALDTRQASPFTPPPPEANATLGFSVLPDEEGTYRTVTVKEGFTVGLCGSPLVSGNVLRLFFSSDEGNTVWLRLQVTTAEGELLGESGLLTPGQCLAELPLSRALAAGSTVKVKVCSYEPETYYSMGAPSFTVRVLGTKD